MAIKTLVPANLNFEQIAQRFPFTDLPTKQRSADYLYWICGTLTNLQLQQLGYDERHRSAHTNMCAGRLREVHHEYEKFMQYLLVAGVIETDGIYREGEKCKGYRYSSLYEAQELKEVVLKEYILNKKINKSLKKHILEHRKKLRGYMHIVKWAIDGKLQIDGAAARIWIARYLEQETQYLESQDMSAEIRHKELKTLADTCNRMRKFVDRIESGGFDETEFSVCKAGERLHGLFTYNKKELRNFITYDGAQLCSVDVKNSQPYFGTVLFNRKFWTSKRGKTEIIQLWRVAQDIYEELRSNRAVYNTVTMLDSSESLTQLDVSTGRYKNLVVTGQLYEFLMVELPKRLSTEYVNKYGYKIATRQEIKQVLLSVMYSDNYPTDSLSGEIKRVFGAMFPVVSKLFAAIKMGNYRRL